MLGHNFRNNYEVAVDSFGTLWQSDNDDDGNRGVRINYRHGVRQLRLRRRNDRRRLADNRTNMEAEIPLRHWHLNDPGVVPNLLHTGAGSPTGICVYEGKLLPQFSANQMIHCDAGPTSAARLSGQPTTAPATRPTIVNILDGKPATNGSGPSDVCVAPDGSLFVADWYDPGVGGHRMGDIDKGRIFRVAPPKAAYEMPKYDSRTTDGSGRRAAKPEPRSPLSGLDRPARDARAGRAGVAEALRIGQPARSRPGACGCSAARGPRPAACRRGLKDADADIRITALAGRPRVGLDVLPAVKLLVHDPSPQVRRECAMRLAAQRSPRPPSFGPIWPRSTTATTAGISKPWASAPTASGTPASPPGWRRSASNWNTPGRPRHCLAVARPHTAEYLAKSLPTGHASRRAAALLPGLRLPDQRHAARRWLACWRQLGGR